MRAIVWTIVSLFVLYPRHTHVYTYTHMYVVLRYEFVNPSDKHVQWLWEVLEEFDNDDRARFIDFCYARCAPK